MKTFHRILRSVFSLSIFVAATLSVEAATPFVTAWGAGTTNTNIEPEFGQSIVPASLNGVANSPAGQIGLTAAVSGGLYHSVALKNDGSVVAWGAGTTNVAGTINLGQSIVPAGLSTVSALATIPANPAGTIKTVTMTVATAVSDSIVVGMVVTGPTGTVGAGATVVTKATAAGVTTLTLSVPNAVSTVDTAAHLLISPLSPVTAVATGGFHTLALKADGTVLAWGAGTTNAPPGINLGQSIVPAGLVTLYNVAAQIPNNTTGLICTVTIALPADAAKIIPGMFVTGPGNSVGIGAKVVSVSGTVVTLSLPNLNSPFATLPTPVTLNFYSGVVAIAAGYYHSVALKSDGSVVAWGGDLAAVPTVATVPPGLQTVAANAALPINPNPPGTADTITFTLVNNINVIPGMLVTGPPLTVGNGAIILSKTTASPFVMQLSVPNAPNTAAATVGFLFSPAPSAKVTAIAAGNEHTVALKSDGTVVAWGRNVESQTSGLATVAATAALNISPYPVGTSNSTVTLSAVNPGIVPGMLVTGPALTVGVGAKVVSVTGLIVTLSVPNLNIALTPAAALTFSSGIKVSPVLAANPATAAKLIAAGGDTSYAVMADTTVQAWGDNTSGQATIPAGLTGVKAIAAAAEHAVALKNDATVTVWGKLWNGSAYYKEADFFPPVGLTGVTAIAAGAYHTLALGAPPLTTPPTPSVIVTQGGGATLFAGTYLGTGYQWQRNGFNIPSTENPSAITPTLTLSNVQATDLGSYTVVITYGSGSIITSPPTELKGNFPVTITTQPINTTVSPGGTATFTVQAPGATYFQWYKDGVAIPGAASSTLTLTNARASDVASYTVVCANAIAVLTSDPALLSWVFPAIISQPLSYIAPQPGVNVSFDVTATGGTPLVYQWRKNGVAISTVSNPSAGTNVLTLTNVQTTNVGSYSVMVTNSTGSVTSKIASLKVIPASVIVKPAITSSLATLNLTKGMTMAPTYTVTANTSNPVFSVKGLPKGLKLNSKTGQISGTPAKLGVYLVVLQAKSKNAGMASASKYFVVNP